MLNIIYPSHHHHFITKYNSEGEGLCLGIVARANLHDVY